MPFTDSSKGQTHSLNDGCGMPEHNYDLKFCEDCQQMTNHLQTQCRKCDTPKGYSKWLEHGERYGYCGYFEKELKDKIANELL
jgi:hypothetical protein